MAENVKPHRFGQQQKNHEPARRAADKRNPRRVRATARAQHEPQGPRRARANGQQQNCDDKFDPLRHGESLTADFADSTDFQKAGCRQFIIREICAICG